MKIRLAIILVSIAGSLSLSTMVFCCNAISTIKEDAKEEEPYKDLLMYLSINQCLQFEGSSPTYLANPFRENFVAAMPARMIPKEMIGRSLFVRAEESEEQSSGRRIVYKKYTITEQGIKPVD